MPCAALRRIKALFSDLSKGRLFYKTASQNQGIPVGPARLTEIAVR